MTTTVGASTSYQLTVPALSETADIQVALKLLSYGISGDPSNDAGIASNSLVGYLKTGLALKSNIASPTFTGIVYAPTIKPATSGNTTLSLSTVNQTSSSGSISIVAGDSTSNGSGGSITLTAGSYTASGAAGNININAGGGPTTGSVNIQNSMGNNGAINLGGSSSTTAVGGNLTVGGGFGDTGVTISSSGAISANSTITSSASILFEGKSGTVTTQDTGYYLSSNGSILASRTGGTPLYAHRYGTSGTVAMVQFLYNGATNGTINVASGGTPAFASGSDYRMKTDITPVTNAIERMKNAKAYTFYKINEIDPSDTLHTGFLAHELAEVQPDSVIGEKDAVDENGKPVYQEVMEIKIIPVMAQAINDLIGMVEKLNSRIEELESK